MATGILSGGQGDENVHLRHNPEGRENNAGGNDSLRDKNGREPNCANPPRPNTDGKLPKIRFEYVSIFMLIEKN